LEAVPALVDRLAIGSTVARACGALFQSLFVLCGMRTETVEIALNWWSQERDLDWFAELRARQRLSKKSPAWRTGRG